MVPDSSRVLDHHGGKHEHTGRHGARIVKRLQLTHKWEGRREWTNRKCHVLLKTQNQSSVTHFFLPKHSNIESTEAICIQTTIEKLNFYVYIYLYITLPWTFPKIVNYWVARTRNSEKLSVFLKNDGKHHLPSLNTGVILQRCVEPALLLILSADDWLNPRWLQEFWPLTLPSSTNCSYPKSTGNRSTVQHLFLVFVSQNSWYHLTNYRLSVF